MMRKLNFFIRFLYLLTTSFIYMLFQGAHYTVCAIKFFKNALRKNDRTVQLVRLLKNILIRYFCPLLLDSILLDKLYINLCNVTLLNVRRGRSTAHSSPIQLPVDYQILIKLCLQLFLLFKLPVLMFIFSIMFIFTMTHVFHFYYSRRYETEWENRAPLCSPRTNALRPSFHTL